MYRFVNVTSSCSRHARYTSTWSETRPRSPALFPGKGGRGSEGRKEGQEDDKERDGRNYWRVHGREWVSDEERWTTGARSVTPHSRVTVHHRDYPNPPRTRASTPALTPRSPHNRDFIGEVRPPDLSFP